MPPRTQRFYFARLNVLGGYEDKRAFLLQGLKSQTTVHRGGVEWAFFSITPLTLENEDFLHGYLVKYRPRATEEVAVVTTRQLTEEDVNNRVAAKAGFLLHVTTGILAFHAVSGQIPPATFATRFGQVFNNAFHNFFVMAAVEFIEEEMRLLELLASFEHLENVRISLHPSNPSNRERWARIDARIQAMGASTYREEFFAGPGKSLNVSMPLDSDLADKVVMAEDGYGRAVATGVLNGDFKSVSTSQNPVTVQLLLDDDSPESLAGRLLGPFQRVLQRFRR